jgi:chloride channel 3/4/5
MFELTGALQYVVPFMTGVLVAKWVGDAFNVGIYDYYILVKQYPYLHEEPEDHMYEMRAEEVMEDSLIVLEEDGYTVGSLLGFCKQYLFYGFPIVTNSHDGTLLGYLPRDKTMEVLMHALKEKRVRQKTQVVFFPPEEEDFDQTVMDLSDLVDETVMRMVPSTPMDQVHNVFKSLGTRVVFLVARDRLVGVITKKNLLKAAHSHGDSNKTKHDAVSLSLTAADDVEEAAMPDNRFTPRRATTMAHMNVNLNLQEPLLSDVTETESESDRSSDRSKD